MTEMSTMSKVSEMESTAGTSQVAVSGTGEGGQDNRSGIHAVIICLLVMGFMGVVIFFVVSAERGGATEAAVEGTESSDDGGAVYVKPTPATEATSRSMSPAPSTTAAPTRPASTRTVTTTAAPRQELICTVGNTASMSSLYPADGLCQYIYYTHVLITGDRIRGAETHFSYEVFQNMSKKYSTTEAGISFDVRYVNTDELAQTRSQNVLSSAVAANIKHFGALNLLFEMEVLKTMVERAEKMIQAFKTAQNNDKDKRTIVALGTSGYSDQNTMEAFKGLVKQAAAEKFKADTVIVISSFWFVNNIYVVPNCKAAPPNALAVKSGNEDYPSLNVLGELVKASFEEASNQPTVMGLSMEMGAIFYEVDNDLYNGGLDKIPYAKCRDIGLVSTDTGCRAQGRSSILYHNETATMIAVTNDPKDPRAVLWDTLETIKYKLEVVKQWPLRGRFAWLLLDVDMITPGDPCSPKASQYNVINEFKTQFPTRP